MNPKIEVIEMPYISYTDFEKFRNTIKQFAETHKIINISTAIASGSIHGGNAITATILYEEADDKEKE